MQLSRLFSSYFLILQIDSMESEESPLDVLSRAATMVSHPTYEETKSYSNKDMLCSKWRRERRQVINSRVTDTPLDFSTKHINGKPPPSYSQSVQCKMSRPSVIKSACTVSPCRDGSAESESKSRSKSSLCSSTYTDDVCDPAIDEHFRRSLGKDYSSIFSKGKIELSKFENFESDSTGLTVDDHFAKALGDTWTKLKEKENEEKKFSKKISNNNHLGYGKQVPDELNDKHEKKKKKILEIFY